jgi:ketosteroid isomerase-like protein
VRRLALIPLLIVAGCGGGDDDRADIEGVVKDFATAVSKSDGETVCNELVTRDYVEKIVGATGDNAIEQCEKQISTRQQGKLKIAKFDKVEIKDDKATVTAQIEFGGTKAPQVFRLEKQDGDFRLTSNQP